MSQTDETTPTAPEPRREQRSLRPRSSLQSVLATPPHLGAEIERDTEYADGVLFLLTHTTDKEEAEQIQQERSEEAQLRRKLAGNTIIERCIRGALGKPEGEITPVDLLGITSLDLSNELELSDVGPLASLTNLQELNLYNTSVSDVGPLASLTNLQELYLNKTSVSDVGPLASLTNLHTLNLYNTSVSDVGPLASLTNLRELYLNNTSVSDVGPLASLTNLQTLSLYKTSVSDVGPLASLTNLDMLNLDNTSVSDVGPLASLTSLRRLDLDNTSVSDVGPLASLTNLHTLYLQGTTLNEDKDSLRQRFAHVQNLYLP